MDPVASFPSFSDVEFQTACTALVQSYESLRTSSATRAWTNVEIHTHHHEYFCRITQEVHSREKEPHYVQGSTEQGIDRALSAIEHEDNLSVHEEEDDEVLYTPNFPIPLIHYDILLSPTYRVPALYFYISDPLHRYPPTMSTLYTHIISPEYIHQTKDVGVLGGITITDHPVGNRPVFFVHPCRTAEVMEAIAGQTQILPVEYLLMWIGAMGKCVGLNVPLEVGVEVRKINQRRR